MSYKRKALRVKNQVDFKSLADALVPKSAIAQLTINDLDMVGRLTADCTLPPMGPTIHEKNYASNFYEILAGEIKAFDEALDDDHEVGMRLVSFGNQITFYIKDLGYADPSLIFFYGITENNQSVFQLIQHVSQINVLLLKMPKLNPEEPKRRLGFLGDGSAPNGTE